MRSSFITCSKFLWVPAALWLAACGGESDGDDGGGAGMDGSAGMSAAGTDSQTVPETCSAPNDCPSGYVCVPKEDTPLMTVLDQPCFDNCSAPCELAGPIKEMCLNNCTKSCERHVPVEGHDVEGTCMRDPGQGGGNQGGAGGTGGGVSGTGGGTSGTGGGGESFTWSGAWTADVKHTSKCNWTSNATQTGEQSYTVTINATGANSAPKATISGGFELEGTGGDDYVNLTGDFPFRSWKGEVAKTNSLNSPNNATIKITTVESPKKISGTIEGSWNASAGWTCETESGSITLTR